jgi:nucleoid-associated protein YgaU
VPDLHRPPLCTLRWGKNKVFEGVVQSLNRTYVMFLEDGTPVRATVDCSFFDARIEQIQMNSADVVKAYTVRPGDTLMGIAAAYYNDTSQWRAIATANDIRNPLKLRPGTVLTIPALT